MFGCQVYFKIGIRNYGYSFDKKTTKYNSVYKKMLVGT